MSKLGLVVVMVLMLGRTNAQNYPAPNNEPLTYFVLIQADDGQAFYVRLDSQLYSSSPEGHLILAPLKDSVYAITVGFPNFPEQRYLLNIRQKDWALRLSRRDNRWGLFDDQGQTVPIAADSGANEKPLLAGEKKDDAFSQLMAAIVRDTAVIYNTYAATSPDSAQPPATAIAPVMNDSAAHTATAKPGSPTDTLSVHPVVSSPVPSAPTGVVKLSEHKSTRSLSLVYTDHMADKKTDTIDVVIPVDSGTVTVRTPQSSSDAAHATTLRVQSVDTSHSMTADTRNTRLTDTPNQAGASHKSGLPFINSDCHAFATDFDVDKLRVRMLNFSKEDDRIQTAYKVFKTKCFSTMQVGTLSEVFTTDAAKFKFLQTAYPFVSDDHFPELINLLTDPVYTDRFRTMTDRH
jgi:hypothetical protein